MRLFTKMSILFDSEIAKNFVNNSIVRLFGQVI